MRQDEIEKAVALALGLGVVVFYRQEIVATVHDVVSRGTQLTSTALTGDVKGKRWIDVDPEDLAAEAEAAFGQSLAHGGFSSLDVYGLARMSRSEADHRDGDDSRVARMHVALNDQGELGWGLSRLFTYSKYSPQNGLYGEQGGRRYATTKDPFAGDILLAWRAIDEQAQGIDPTAGGVKFVDKDSMGKQPGTGSFEALVERWAGENLVPYNIDGLGSNFFVFRREA